MAELVNVHWGEELTDLAAITRRKRNMIYVTNWEPDKPDSPLHKRPDHGSFGIWLYDYQENASSSAVWWEEAT